MTRFAVAKQHLREQAEHHLRVAAMEELRPHTAKRGYQERGALFWRWVFVPLYQRIPWSVKERAMHSLRMTAESSGWTPPERRPGEPWQPPAARRGS